MTVLVTGAAGFIGFHVCRALLSRGEEVLGVDNFSDFYDPALKEARLHELEPFQRFTFRKVDLADQGALEDSVSAQPLESVIHLAAQAGVRGAPPRAYLRDNLVAQLEVLDFCSKRRVGHLVNASTSAVYGANTKLPHAVGDRVDQPISVYAATKRGGELLAGAWSSLHDLPITSLRFFTVYGPWGRPDMAVWKFTEALLEGRPIRLHGRGQMYRSFTYVDDVVGGVLSARSRVPKPAASGRRHAIYNLGNPCSVDLDTLVTILESLLGRKATRQMVDATPGEVRVTRADISSAASDLGFDPATPLEQGLRHFVEWYRRYSEERPSR